MLFPFLQRAQPAFHFALQQAASFSRYISKSRQKRLPMTTKRAGKGYYKGKGGRKEGRLTSKGIDQLWRYISFSICLIQFIFCIFLPFLARFIVDVEKRTELMVPDLTDFKVCLLIHESAYLHLLAIAHIFLSLHEPCS